MNTLVLGDVHGCYYTFKKLLKDYFQPASQTMVQLGDLLNKGPHSAKCIEYCWHLERKHAGKVVFLRGNHEQAFIDSFRQDLLKKEHPKLLANIKAEGIKPKVLYKWLLSKPLSVQLGSLLISHAGISEASKDPYRLNLPHNLLENRKPIQKLSLTQVVGHQVLSDGKPLFKAKENTWYIDTGAYLGQSLSALQITDQGFKIHSVPTLAKDLA
jgi:serine/threonine protein phosphatase 1